MTPADLFRMLREHGFVPDDAIYATLDADTHRRLLELYANVRHECRLDFMTGDLDAVSR